MKFIALLCVIAVASAAIVGSYVDENGREIDHHVGSYLIQDKQNNIYRLKYDVEMLGGNLIVNMDEVKGIRRLNCDLTNIEMVVDFNSVPDAYAFYKQINMKGNEMRFISGGDWNCSDIQTNSWMLLRRVLDVEINGVSVLMRTTTGTYEEAIKEGWVNLDVAEVPQEHSKTLCLGVNNNKQCDHAERPLPIYRNTFIDVTCSNCFIGAKATVFLDFKISWFKLRHISTGLKDIGINAGFVLDLTAQGSATGTVDKTFRIVDAGLVIQFWIGPIPIVIWYEIPLRLVANAMIMAKAHAAAGVTANWKLGNAYVHWDENHGWHIEKPHPQFEWKHIFEAEASVDAEADLSLIPSIIVHACQIVSAGMSLAPKLMFEAHGDTHSKQLCLDAAYNVEADVFSEITINLPFIKAIEKKFGPYKVFETGKKPIGHWCIKG